jgi:hypothetical protein
VTGGDGGSGTWTGALNTTGLTDGHTYTWLARATDGAANHADTPMRTFIVDNSTPSLSLDAPTSGTSPASQYYNAAAKTLWLNSADSGSFNLNATATDAQSGIAKVRFSALLGTGATDDLTSPYQSSAYNFAPGTNSGAVNVTAFNGATIGSGANTSTDAFTISADAVAPTAFSLGGPADTAKIGTDVTVSAAPTDADSGVRNVAFFYCDLAGGPCVPSIQIGMTQTTPAAGVYSVSWNTTGLTDGHTYAVDAIATDNVGHTGTSAANSVLVDNSAPVLSVAAPTAVTGNAYQSYDAANKKLWLSATQTGTFTLRANASDPDSGISSVTFPALLGTGSNAGTLNTGVYESSTYTFNSPTAPGVKSISAANGVTNPIAATSSDSIDVEVDGTAPATNATFPQNNGSYDNTNWNPGCTTPGICGTVNDGGSGVGQVRVSIKDRTTGMYWGGTAFDQASQTLDTAVIAANTWSYALDQSKLTSPHSYLVELYSVDNVGNAETQQQVRFTYGSDVGGPATTLTLSSATHAYLSASAPYVLYYGTTNGAGSFTLRDSATDPSGVDTIAFPDLSGTTGFSGTGGSSTNGSNADPFIATASYGFTSAATTAPGAKNVTAADLRGNLGPDRVTFVLDNSAPTGDSLTINGGSAYSTAASFAVSHLDYTGDTGGSGVASSVFTVASATLTNGTCGAFGAVAPAADGTFSGTGCATFTLSAAMAASVANTKPASTSPRAT